MADSGISPELKGEQVRLTPTVESDGPRLREIHSTLDVSEWWDMPDPGFPMTDEPESTRFTIRLGDEIVGLVQYGEEDEPKYRHAWMDIFVEPAFHGRGFGSEALTMLLRHLVEDRGHHRVTIDPAAHNEAAVACYRKVGFTPVGVMRKAERDFGGGGWHDSLMMEFVVEPSSGTE